MPSCKEIIKLIDVIRFFKTSTVALLLLGVNNVHAINSTANVEFKGELISPGCQLVEGSDSIDVFFPALIDKYFSNNSQSKPQTFTISLINCDEESGEAIYITFKNEENIDDPELFSVSGEAEGIGIAIENTEGKRFKNGHRERISLIQHSEENLRFNAFVQALPAANLKPGEFTSIVNFIIDYE